MLYEREGHHEQAGLRHTTGRRLWNLLPGKAMYNPLPIFRFIQSEHAAGRAAALVTIIAVTGSSARSCGTHMAVSENGCFAGSLTGGCIEAAVVAEAQEALIQKAPRTIRYGAGSPFIDIRLPCGGSVVLVINPLIDSLLGEQALVLFEERQSFTLTLGGDAQSITPADHDLFACKATTDAVVVHHIPPLQLALFGHAAAMPIVRDLALACGAHVVLASPDPDLVRESMQKGCSSVSMVQAATAPLIRPDLWTAGVVLFHDHDWEPATLRHLLASKAFFIGAMGSHKTQRERLAVLARQGVTVADQSRVIGPIGAIPSMRDPETLAVSVFAQVVDAYNKRFLNGGHLA